MTQRICWVNSVQFLSSFHYFTWPHHLPWISSTFTITKTYEPYTQARTSKSNLVTSSYFLPCAKILKATKKQSSVITATLQRISRYYHFSRVAKKMQNFQWNHYMAILRLSDSPVAFSNAVWWLIVNILWRYMFMDCCNIDTGIQSAKWCLNVTSCHNAKASQFNLSQYIDGSLSTTNMGE